MAEDPTTGEDLLTRIARGHDRDVALFFTGRNAEIGAFEDAVRDARHIDQTQFRIFQGAPGCGKTSLLTHLRDTAPEHRVFVSVGIRHLTSHDALAAYITRELREATSTFAKGVAWILREGSGVAESSVVGRGLHATGEALDDRAIAKVRQESEVVLTLDEAQVLDERHEEVLLALHTEGLEGLHTVFAFAGLSHTGTVIRQLAGLSRLTQNANVNMGLLGNEECAESTRLMLARCRIPGTDTQHAETAKRVGAMAQQWPQHLACAHAALACELIRVDRDLGRVDLAIVERNTTQARQEYYRARLQGHPVMADERFTARLVGMVHGSSPKWDWQLADVCEAALQRPDTPERLRRRGDAEELAKTVVAQGILSQPGVAEPYRATIPSMSTWLGEQLPCGDPERRLLIAPQRHGPVGHERKPPGEGDPGVSDEP